MAACGHDEVCPGGKSQPRNILRRILLQHSAVQLTEHPHFVKDIVVRVKGIQGDSKLPACFIHISGHGFLGGKLPPALPAADKIDQSPLRYSTCFTTNDAMTAIDPLIPKFIAPDFWKLKSELCLDFMRYLHKILIAFFLMAAFLDQFPYNGF